MAAGSSGAPWMPKPGDDYSYNQFSTYGDANAAGAYYQVGSGMEAGQGMLESGSQGELLSVIVSGITLAELMSLLVSWFSLSGLKHYGFMLNHIDLKLPKSQA